MEALRPDLAGGFPHHRRVGNHNFQATRFLDLFDSSDYSRVTFVGSPRRAGPFVSLASGLGAPAPGRPCGSHSGPATSCGAHYWCRLASDGGAPRPPHVLPLAPSRLWVLATASI